MSETRVNKMSSEVEEGLRTLTVRELASATGIQVWRIHQMVALGDGPPNFRVGRVIRFRVKDVQVWMERLTSTKRRVHHDK